MPRCPAELGSRGSATIDEGFLCVHTKNHHLNNFSIETLRDLRSQISPLDARAIKLLREKVPNKRARVSLTLRLICGYLLRSLQPFLTCIYETLLDI